MSTTDCSGHPLIFGLAYLLKTYCCRIKRDCVNVAVADMFETDRRNLTQ